MKTVFDLKLHERAWFTDLENLNRVDQSDRSWVMRVPSGWVYSFDGDKVFVPFDDKLRTFVKGKDF
jgi:hypothetical protein